MRTLTPDMPIAERRLALAEALESGAFTQAIGHLRVVYPTKTSHCCLGVACELYRQAHPNGTQWKGATDFDGRWASMPNRVMDWYGFSHGDGRYEPEDYAHVTCLSQLNDSGVPFTEIAKIIRAEPPGLFKNPT